MGFPGEVSYGAAKSALENYTMSASIELAYRRPGRRSGTVTARGALRHFEDDAPGGYWLSGMGRTQSGDGSAPEDAGRVVVDLL